MPAEPNLLYSVLNTMLRDKYKSLEELCEDLAWEKSEIEEILGPAGMEYTPFGNRIIRK